MPVNYHNNKEGNKWWCQKGATRFLKQWGQKSFFFFALFSVTDVNVLSCGSDLIRHSQMDFIVLYGSPLFMNHDDDEGLFFLFFFSEPYAKGQLRQKPLINNKQSIQFYQSKQSGGAQQPLSTRKHPHARKHATKHKHRDGSSNLNFMSDWVSWWMSEGPRFLRDGI